MLSGKVWPNGEVWAGHLPSKGSQLGLSNLHNNHNAPPGSKGISRNGKRKVRQGAYLVETEAGKRCMSFLTCTLPGGSSDDAYQACRLWGEIVRRFIQELRRELLRRGLSGDVVGCTEIQPKRFATTGEVWPHLHVVFRGKKRAGPWLISKKRANLMWARCVNAVLGIPMEDLAASTRIETIRTKKSVAQYLGKYLSKGEDDCQEYLEKNPGIKLPTQWHHCNHGLNQQIKADTVKLRPKTAAFVIQLLMSTNPGAKLFTTILPHGDDDPWGAPIGYVGMLDPPLKKTIVEYNRLRNEEAI